ncbi:hypothetical protein ACS0TY_014038 [Phlomoides rotata]
MEDAYLVEPIDDDDRIANMVDVDYDATEWCREDVPPTVVEIHPNELTKETHIDTRGNNLDLELLLLLRLLQCYIALGKIIWKIKVHVEFRISDKLPLWLLSLLLHEQELRSLLLQNNEVEVS